MKKGCLLGGIVVISLLAVLTGCSHTHTWTDATCTEPMTCSECGETEGEALGHTWIDATCTEPMTCEVCGETEGEALGHTWIDATCVEPMTCEICGEAKGETLGHTWIDATCTEPMTCEVCGETKGEALGHIWIDANYQAPQTCSVCGNTEGEVLTPAWIEHGMPETYMEIGKEYEYTTLCQDLNLTTTGKASIISYDVFESDNTHEAVDGYEWHVVRVRAKFSDSNAQNYGVWMGPCWSDYYDIKGTDDSNVYDENEVGTFSVNWYGENYTKCQFYETSISADWDETGTIGTIITEECFLLPDGYDGMIFGLYNFSTKWGEGMYIYDVADEGTLFFRLQQVDQSSEIEGSKEGSDDTIETIMSDFVATFSTPPTIIGPVTEDGVTAYTVEHEGSTAYIFYTTNNNGASTIGILPGDLDSDTGASTLSVIIGEMIYVVDPAITRVYDGISLFFSLYDGGTTTTKGGVECTFSPDTFLFTITF